MNVILILIPVSLVLAAGFLAAFFWAVRSGQYEDTCTPSLRILAEEDSPIGERVEQKAVTEISHED